MHYINYFILLVVHPKEKINVDLNWVVPFVEESKCNPNGWPWGSENGCWEWVSGLAFPEGTTWKVFIGPPVMDRSATTQIENDEWALALPSRGSFDGFPTSPHFSCLSLLLPLTLALWCVRIRGSSRSGDSEVLAMTTFEGWKAPSSPSSWPPVGFVS